MSTAVHTSNRHDPHHFVLCPWPMFDGRAGGIDSVFIKEYREAEAAARPVTFLTADKSERQGTNTRVIPSVRLPFEFDGLISEWFGVGDWVAIHSDAFCSATLPKTAVERMFAHHIDVPHRELGNKEHLIEVLKAKELKSRPSIEFNQGFSKLLDLCKPGDIVHFQDFFTAPALIQLNTELKNRGIKTTLHHHESIPNGFSKTPQGERLLRAMLCADKVLFHTDQDLLRAETQLRSLMSPKDRLPKLERFDLGVDFTRFDPNNVKTNCELADWLHQKKSVLSQAQISMVDDIINSRDCVPHRFACFDRLDPNKGSLTWILAVEEFLYEQSQRMSLDELRSHFRFYGAHDLIYLNNYDPTGFKDPYIELCKNIIHRVASQFPGVFFAVEPFQGECRDILPSLIHGCHSATGGSQDGLNLVLMEGCLLNRANNTTLISGRGTGFVIQSITNGSGDLGFFPKPGDIEGFTKAIRTVVTEQKYSVTSLREKKEELIRREILGRNSIMAVDVD